MWAGRLLARSVAGSLRSICLANRAIFRMSTETVIVPKQDNKELENTSSVLPDDTTKQQPPAILAEKSTKENSEAENGLKRLPEDAVNEEPPAKKQKLKKKKVAMLLSYCGQGYYGMQINHGFKTIEGELFDAFLKLGIMDEEAHKSPNLVQFQRAARTDKGVSAIKQLVSFKMPLTEEDTVKKMCELLPSCIKVFAIKKTTAGFNSKIACDSRTYAYVMPTFAFSPTETAISKEFRLSEEKLAELNEVLGLYKGTKNYHNFTSRRIAKDPSCQRYIMDFSSSKPYLVDDIEYVKLTVKGQSFMLNQIRKMIGLAISMMRGLATKENFESAFNLERIDIPIAPSLNLLLEEPHYNSYNRKFGNDGIHEALDWSPFEDDITKFCEEHVYPTIYKGEKEEGSMASWLPALNLHTFGPRGENESKRCSDSDS